METFIKHSHGNKSKEKPFSSSGAQKGSLYESKKLMNFTKVNEFRKS